jgi:hypothetical protein
VGDLVLASFEMLEAESENSKKKGGPYKPSTIAEVAFKVAPDGKYRGMKFKRIEVIGALKQLVTQGKLYSVLGKAGAHKYSTYPLVDASKASGFTVLGGIRVPIQSIEWPQWPSPSAVQTDEACRAAKAEYEASQSMMNNAKSNPPETAEETASREENRRRGSREVRSRFIEVDGHVVLKANNYSLEEGESSVWGNEVERALPPPKKPLTAYMLFSKQFRDEHFPPMDEEEKKERKRKLASEARAKKGGGGGGGGGVSAKTSVVAQMELLVAAWRELGEDKKKEYEAEAELLRKKYDEEVEEWRVAVEAQNEARLQMKSKQATAEVAAVSRTGTAAGLVRNNSSSVNWGDEVMNVLEASEPGGVHFGRLQEVITNSHTPFFYFIYKLFSLPFVI